MTNIFIVRFYGYCMRNNRTMGGEPRKGSRNCRKEGIMPRVNGSFQLTGNAGIEIDV